MLSEAGRGYHWRGVTCGAQRMSSSTAKLQETKFQQNSLTRGHLAFMVHVKLNNQHLPAM